MAQFFLTDEEKITLTVVGKTALGRVKPVPSPTWSFDSPAAGALFSASGAVVDFVSADNVPSQQSGTVTVRSGTLLATAAITVDPAAVVSLEIQAGAPALKSL